jgi:hypothetical protein
MAESNSEFAALLANYPPAVQAIAAGLREMIFETLPQPIEMIDRPRKLIGYGFGSRYADMVCTIIPSKGGVKLGLAYGASLSDPKNLLAGAGKVHRHVNFTTLADIKRPGVRPLLTAALAAQRARVSGS